MDQIWAPSLAQRCYLVADAEMSLPPWHQVRNQVYFWGSFITATAQSNRRHCVFAALASPASMRPLRPCKQDTHT